MEAKWCDPIHGRCELEPVDIVIQGLNEKIFSTFGGDGGATVTPRPISARMVVKSCGGVDFNALRYMPELEQESTPGSLELRWKEAEVVVMPNDRGTCRSLLLDDVYIESVSHMDDGSTVINITARPAS